MGLGGLSHHQAAGDRHGVLLPLLFTLPFHLIRSGMCYFFPQPSKLGRQGAKCIYIYIYTFIKSISFGAYMHLMMIIIIIITIGFTGVKRAEEGEEGEGPAMPSSASAGAAPERRGRAPPGAPRSGCAPSPARPVAVPTGFFGLQRLWQDGDAEHKSCSQSAPHSPAPHQVAGGAESRRPPRPAAPRTPSRTHP